MFSMSTDGVGQCDPGSDLILSASQKKSASGISWQCQGMSADSCHRLSASGGVTADVRKPGSMTPALDYCMAYRHGRMGTLRLRGAVDLPEILHMIFFLLALPRFSPLFCSNLGGQLPPPPPPASYAYANRYSMAVTPR